MAGFVRDDSMEHDDCQMSVSKGILGFKVERSAVESGLDSLVRSRLTGLDYSSAYHRIHRVNMVTTRLQSVSRVMCMHQIILT